jgi:hypothetical protein
MYEEQDYGKCRCGAKKVKNPKTGKIFCSDKCWLTSDSPSELKKRPETGERNQIIQDTTKAPNAALPADFEK